MYIKGDDTDMENSLELNCFSMLLFNQSMEDISGDLKQFQLTKSIFYYDETNNIRKLRLNETDFNAPIDNDFVLGGVMHFDDSFVFDFDSLKKDLRLQSTAKELKFKHITNKTDFLSCLSQSKVQIFLQWLYRSELYLHYSTTNSLYFAIVDIIGDIEDIFPIPCFLFSMKNELYKLARTNYDVFYRLLKSHGYPNIDKDSIAPFYQGIIDLIDTNSVNHSSQLKQLRQLFINARSQDNLVLLQDNPKDIILDDYHSFYLRSLGTFPTAYHLFDHEYLIEEQFNKYDQICYDGIQYKNFDFIDSKDSPLIQVSDCIIALVGKYQTFINNLDPTTIEDTLSCLNPQQKNNLKLFAQIIKKSLDISDLLVHSVNSSESGEIDDIILDQALLFDTQNG